MFSPIAAAIVLGLLVVSVQKWALSTGKTVIEKTIRQCSRETAFLKRSGDRVGPLK